MEPNASEKEAKREPKGSQRAPKVSQTVPKGSQGEPKGNQREPKVSQGATKMHPKINLRKRSRKSEAQGGYQHQILEPFWSHFPSKIDEKIDAKIDAEKVMKIDEKSMRKWSEIYRKSIQKMIVSEKCLMQNNLLKPMKNQ